MDATYRTLRRTALLLPLLLCALVWAPALADAPASPEFQRTWARTDQPVAGGDVARTWMWGPEAFTPLLTEEYNGGLREVQYFDKSRMEVTSAADIAPTDAWYVTNGLLVLELIRGRVQVGDNAFEERTPAWINVAGDADDPLAPTYATFSGLLDAPTGAEGAPITATLSRYATIGNDPALAGYGVSAGYRVTEPGIDHRVASVFWEFMTSAGVIWEDGGTTEGPLFANPFYATGYPVSEPYWTRVRVAGVRLDVLVQCFERRCLTYTPGNSAGWRVEAGNVGRHYYQWRYSDWPGTPPPAGDLLFAADLSAIAPFSLPTGSGGWQGQSYVISAAAGAPGQELFVQLDEAEIAQPVGDQFAGLDLRLSSGGPDAFACLTVRGVQDAAGRSHYALCIDGHQTISAMWESFDSGGRLLTYTRLLEFSPSSALHPAGQWNRLEIIAAGDRFWFLVNDTPVGSTRHSGPSAGYPGFLLLNDGTGAASAEYRDLSINTLLE